MIQPHISTYVRIIANALILMATIVLLGWHFNIAAFKSLVPGYTAMNPLTAISFITIACWQLFWLDYQITKQQKVLFWIYVLAGFVFLVGTIRLYDIISGVDHSIDKFLYPDQIEHGRISPMTAFGLAVLGFSMLLSTLLQKYKNLILFLVAPVFITAWISFFGYLIGNNNILTARPFKPMALHTTFSFLVVVVSFLLLFPRNTLVETLQKDDLGGGMARRLLPYILFVPLILGFLRYQGEQLELYDTGFGVAILVVGAMLIFLIVVIRQSRELSTIDQQRREVERKVEQRSEELDRINKELERRNKELEQFAFAASHDMQEPLRKVQTFSNFLLQSHAAQLDEKGRTYLEKINTSVKRMRIIIDDLLRYSHQSKEDQQFVPTDLNTVVKNIETDLELYIQQKGAIIIKENLPAINAIPAQIYQLLYNLVANALKFSRPGISPIIDISAQAIEDASLKQQLGFKINRQYIQIMVSDNGIGFEKQYAEQIFSLFKRLHGRSEYEGTGIGLALCKKIVDNHGGSIWADSEPGNGATFHIVLPAG